MRRCLLAVDALVLVLATTLAAPAATPLERLVVLVLGTAVLRLSGLYGKDRSVMRRSTLDDVPRIVTATGLTLTLVWLVVPGLAPDASRAHVVAAWVGVAAALTLGRALTRATVRATLPPERCLLVGTAGAVRRLRSRLEGARAAVEVADVIVLRGEMPPDLSSVAALTDLRRAQRLERLVIAPFDEEGFDPLDLVRIAKAAGLRVSMLPRAIEVVGAAVQVEEVEGLPMLGVRPLGLSRGARATKRAVDLAVAGVGVLAVAPLLAAIAAAVKLSSPGPVFFRQPRVGRGGEPFGMLKFRSMVADAEARKDELLGRNETAGLFKLAADPRVTRVGRLLRSTSLDELPQLLNVLRGEMSLVGPRPLVLEEDALVDGLDRTRLELTPGMTGPWQVLGGTRVPLAEMVAMDYLYVANWSLWRDLEILVRTAMHVARGGGL